MVRRGLVVLMLPVLVALAPVSQANFGFGIDVVRVVDGNQDPDGDGLFNLFLQVPAGYSGGLHLGYSSSDNLNIVDVAYKHYPGNTMDGAFFQAGAGWYDAQDDDEIGFVGMVGYERRLAKHFVVTGGVRIIAGVDEEIVGYRETPVYQPMLGVMLAF